MTDPIRERAINFIRASLGHPNLGFLHLGEDVEQFLIEEYQVEDNRLPDARDAVLWELEQMLGELK